MARSWHSKDCKKEKERDKNKNEDETNEQEEAKITRIFIEELLTNKEKEFDSGIDSGTFAVFVCAVPRYRYRDAVKNGQSILYRIPQAKYRTTLEGRTSCE